MRLYLSRFLTLLIGTGLSACGPGNAAPEVPEADDALYGGGQQGTGDLEASEVSPTDGLSDTRLATLPPSISSQVEECEEQGRFFNIGTAVCTELHPVDYPCRIDEDFLKRLDTSTLGPLQDYLTSKAQNLQLYACTESGEMITLHFYSYKTGLIRHKELSIAKARDKGE